MCIVLLSTAHPDYPLILLNNRDEFLHRPTARAAFWSPPHSHVFSGRDLARPERGTWLGVTRTGRLAVLTNFHEPSSAAAIGQKSRGGMISSFLLSSLPTPSFLRSADSRGVGGFSMICGELRCGAPLAVVSNRTPAGDAGVETAAKWVCSKQGETHGLSNALFRYDDEEAVESAEEEDSWPKVALGKQLLSEAVEKAKAGHESEEQLVERLFGVLSHDTLPRARCKEEDTYEAEIEALRHSVFIPPFVAAPEHPHPPTPPPEEEIAAAVETKARVEQEKAKAEAEGLSTEGHSAELEALEKKRQEEEEKERWRTSKRLYGTQAQSVVLVDRNGRCKYVERTLYDSDARPLSEEERDVVVEFQIVGWNGEREGERK